MRSFLAILSASVMLGASAGATAAHVDLGHVNDLVRGILRDVGDILESFAGGPDDPKNPVVNSATLREDEAKLDAATRKANQLADELSVSQFEQKSPGERGR